jgi:hypothetical protein
MLQIIRQILHFDPYSYQDCTYYPELAEGCILNPFLTAFKAELKPKPHSQHNIIEI